MKFERVLHIYSVYSLFHNTFRQFVSVTIGVTGSQTVSLLHCCRLQLYNGTGVPLSGAPFYTLGWGRHVWTCRIPQRKRLMQLAVRSPSKILLLAVSITAVAGLGHAHNPSLRGVFLLREEKRINSRSFDHEEVLPCSS